MECGWNLSENVLHANHLLKSANITAHSGVRISIENSESQRYFEGGVFDANPAKYGYRLGSLAECEALKMVLTIHKNLQLNLSCFQVEATSNRHRPDMACSSFNDSDRTTPAAFVMAPPTSSPPAPQQASLDNDFKDSLENRVQLLEETVKKLGVENSNLSKELERIRTVLKL
jgi:hypothetical protein